MQYINLRSVRGRRLMAVALLGGAPLLMVSNTASAAAPAASGGGVWDRVAACESGGDWNIATGNGYYGGLQFSASSWRAAGGGKYANLPHQASKGQQIAVARNLLRMQGPGAWPVCGPKAGLSRGNGGSGSAVPRLFGAGESSNSNAGLSASQVRELQREVGARVDGVVGPETTRKTEQALGLERTGRSTLTKAAYRGALRLID